MTPIIGSPVMVLGRKVVGSIVVNYPSSATVTISPNVVRQDNPTNTQRIYYVSDFGTYIITATATGGAETSQNVTISSQGQTTTITLLFPIYIIKDGIRQLYPNGDVGERYSFTAAGRRYSSYTALVTPTVQDPLDSAYSDRDYISVTSSNVTGYAAGSIYYSYANSKWYSIKPSIDEFPSDSVYLHFHFRLKGGTGLRGMYLGTYYGSAADSTANFLDAITFSDQTASDSAPVHRYKKLTSASTSASTVGLAMAFALRNNYSNIGGDFYDVWLSNVADDIPNE